MFTKTTLAAAAFATAISAGTATLPSAAYASHNLDFSITIDLGNGTLSFGDGGFNPGPMSCWDAKQHLKDDFKHVQKIECNGKIYTFKVKKFNIGPWKTVKLNRNTGNYWIV
jgi:hypothetical protein